jgi:hypothetical protein
LSLHALGILTVLTIGALLLAAQDQQPPAPAAPAPQSTPSPPAAKSETPNPDNAWSIELLYWLPKANPQLRGGAQATVYETVGNIGPSQSSPGVEGSFPLNKNDLLQLSYFQTMGRGASIPSQALSLYGTSFPLGDYLDNQYRVRSAKASFEDILYPYPNQAAKLRFRTLWEVQYLQVSTRTDAPLDASADSTGYISYPTSTATHQVFLPTFGASMIYAPANRLSVELRASAFGIPHHADLVDSAGTVAYQIGPVQILLGGKFLGFKTSPKSEEYVKSSMGGAMVGLRWTVRE